MASRFNIIASRVASTLFVLAVFALVIFLILQVIPQAQRPTLAPTPGTPAVSPSSG